MGAPMRRGLLGFGSLVASLLGATGVCAQQTSYVQASAVVMAAPGVFIVADDGRASPVRSDERRIALPGGAAIRIRRSTAAAIRVVTDSVSPGGGARPVRITVEFVAH